MTARCQVPAGTIAAWPRPRVMALDFVLVVEVKVDFAGQQVHQFVARGMAFPVGPSRGRVIEHGRDASLRELRPVRRVVSPKRRAHGECRQVEVGAEMDHGVAARVQRAAGQVWLSCRDHPAGRARR